MGHQEASRCDLKVRMIINVTVMWCIRVPLFCTTKVPCRYQGSAVNKPLVLEPGTADTAPGALIAASMSTYQVTDGTQFL